MRILFSGRPAYGHLYPLLPLAVAARDAGHQVTLATGAAFVPRLTALGFATHEVGISVGEAETEATRRHPDGAVIDVMLTMFADILPRRTLADLEPLLAAERPDLVIYEMSDVGAAGAARRAGIPAVSVTIGRSLPVDIRTHAAAGFEWIWNGDVPDEPMLGDACLDTWPPGLADPNTGSVPHRFPLRPVPWSPPAPPWRSPGSPLVYLTLGTVVFGATEVFRAALDGLAQLPVRVVVAVGPGDPAALGPLPDRMEVWRFVPQDQVLRHADLVVHHGGSGTTLGAAAHGLPQLVLPQGADQFANAEALTTQGSGLALLGDDVQPDVVAACARTLLGEPVHRATAQVLRDQIAAMPSPTDVLPTLEAFATA
ncbi:glycosyltransferase [Cryptosporangium aurantiacum]|uniref:UDP:flavonoid glycosyltransferase YjiC, YdhE family n=1 Tax=Cryptosporangium aurantiacum TaxID=134849 RepID=A0A1M7KV45_9ACTN|nr:glycosyltransferase [Cryptosporangium aurantiacum]SHM68913.1 UDP:flavonoid glycosyltransferase YjiC, YdhE family [Cryptosporangium aurantiacum]